MRKPKERIRAEVREGMLNADIQSRIGHELRSDYDDVIRQGVPEKFADIVRQIDNASGPDRDV